MLVYIATAITSHCNNASDMDFTTSADYAPICRIVSFIKLLELLNTSPRRRDLDNTRSGVDCKQFMNGSGDTQKCNVFNDHCTFFRRLACRPAASCTV